jgi:hypothetical protein
MVDTRTFRWSDGALVDDPTPQQDAGSVRVADSWLMVDGAVAGLERHIDRFTGSVRHAFPELDIDSFARAALAALPRTGRWFPRIEAIDDGGPLLRLRVREAPEPLTHATLATAPRDPRTAPTVKGPNAEALGELRDRACGTVRRQSKCGRKSDGQRRSKKSGAEHAIYSERERKRAGYAETIV